MEAIDAKCTIFLPYLIKYCASASFLFPLEFTFILMATIAAISLVDKHNAAFEKQSKVKRMGKTVGVSSMGNAPRASALGGFATPSTGL